MSGIIKIKMPIRVVPGISNGTSANSEKVTTVMVISFNEGLNSLTMHLIY